MKILNTFVCILKIVSKKELVGSVILPKKNRYPKVHFS